MVGSKEDPKDGPAVAGAVFGAVIVYVVRTLALKHANTLRRIL
jgi:hypothetical protein